MIGAEQRNQACTTMKPDKRPGRLAERPAGLPFDPLDRDTPEAIVVTDSVGRVTHLSAGASALWGCTPEEVIGRPLADLLTADETAVRHLDGRALDTRLRLFPLGSDERPAGFVLVAGGRPDSGGKDGNAALVKWAFDQHPTAFVIYDHEARIQRLNTAMSRIMGYREDEMRGRFLAEIVPGSVYEEIERRIRRVLKTGRPEYTEPFVRTPGEAKAHAWFMDIFPLKNAAGRVCGVAVSASDFSQQYDSRERLALLSEARTRIGTSLDVAGTAQELAEVVVPRFADVVSVDLLEPVFLGGLPGPLPSGPVPLRRAAYRTAFQPGRNTPARDAPAQDAHARNTPARDAPAPGAVQRHPRSSPLARCLVEGRAVRQAITDDEIVRWLGDDPAQAEQIRACGIRSLIAVPIHAHGYTLGAVLFGRRATSLEPFGPECLAITEDLVARAAVCLDNARRFTRDRGIALALQRSLLPRGPTVHPAVETAVRYLPAGGEVQASGDWFDVIPLPGARVGLAIGDVVGHGVHASATMGRLRTAVRTLADIDMPPDELLTHLDDIVTHAEGEQGADDTLGDIPGDIGATCVYAVYDPVSGTCSLARAGHPAPLLVRPDGSAGVVDLPAGPPLGLGSLPFEATELTLPEGSLLALFTDGLVTGGGRDIDDGVTALRRALAEPASSLEALADSVLETLCPGPRDDDIALLLARTRVLDRDHVAGWDLPADPAVVSEARKRVRDLLPTWELEAETFVTELVVSELVTNAIRYATGPIHLQLVKERSLICEVSDASSTAPHLRRARLSDEGGRGLFMVAELTRRWGTRYTRTGKTIWAEQSIGGV
ncbi:SpoIIE family protein phosphatase [Streptomyces puniciscabiei]|uniref:SpoIIE family protein phosphatase n=1 Tax=Streptomyces puniciscabiei TaxID=164348 RepID=UPI0033334FAD